MPTLFCRDEFGGFYEGLNKLEHQAGGKQVLISMHDGRNYRKELVGLKQIDKESGDLTRTPEVIEVKDPFLSILAGTQRDLFLSQAQPGDVFSGFLPRFGLIVPDGLRNRQDVLEMTPAIEVQRVYLEEAERRFSGRDEDTDWTLAYWDKVLTGLANRSANRRTGPSRSANSHGG